MVSSKKKINAVLSIAVAVIGMGAVTATALASEGNASYMDSCRSELNQHYGKEMDARLVSKRRVPAGTEVKLAARLDQDNVEFLNCWVPNNGAANSAFSQGANSVAVTVTEVAFIQ